MTMYSVEEVEDMCDAHEKESAALRARIAELQARWASVPWEHIWACMGVEDPDQESWQLARDCVLPNLIQEAE